MRSRRWKGLNHFHLLDLIHQEDGNDHAKNCLSQNEKFYEAKNFFFIKSTDFYLPFYVKPRVHLALKLKIKKINFWSLVTKFFEYFFFYTLWKRSRLKSTFLPYRVKKHHSTLEMDTFKGFCRLLFHRV